MCAFFAFQGVIDLKNQAFLKKSTMCRAKKLDVVLRRVTGDAITREQRLQLTRALEPWRQYRFQLYPSRHAFQFAVNSVQGLKGKNQVCILLGDRDSPKTAPMAALVQMPGHGGRMVYLYLPKRKEAARNEPRPKKRKKA